MIGVKDVLAVLDKVSIWKVLQGLPDRVAELERRVAELEAKPKAKGNRCPSCGEFTFRIVKSEKDKIFGNLGGTNNTFECSECGHSEEKIST